MKITLPVVGILLLWIFDWIFFILGGMDYWVHLAPFVIIILALLIKTQEQIKQAGSPIVPLISKTLAAALSVVLVFVYIIVWYYPFLSWLLWNACALIAVTFAYHLTMKDFGMVPVQSTTIVLEK